MDAQAENKFCGRLKNRICPFQAVVKLADLIQPLFAYWLPTTPFPSETAIKLGTGLPAPLLTQARVMPL